MFDIKVRLVKLGLTQAWLIHRLYDLHGVKVGAAQMSRYINGVERTPKGQEVLSLCNELLKEKEAEQDATGTRGVSG